MRRGEQREDVAQPAGRQYQARRPRVVAEQLLREDGDQQHAREHAEPDDRDQRAAGGEVPVGEDGEVQDRIARHQLADQEADERHHGDQHHRDDRGRIEPVLALAPVQDELQTAEAGDHQSEAPPVDPPGFSQIRRVEQERAGHEEAEHADRQVDVEDPAPRPLVGQVAADGGPEDRAEDEADAPHRHGEPALMEREDLPEDRLRERNDRAAAETLEDARDDQRGEVGRRTGQERADHEQRGADEEEPLAAEQADQPAGGRNDHGVGGEVRRDHPRHLVQSRRQRALQVRQDHVGHAGVEDLHEGHHHDREGDGPLLGGGDGRFRRWRRHCCLADRICGAPAESERLRA